MSRFTIIFLVAGAACFTFAATYWLVAQNSDTTAEAATEDRRPREKFFKAPEEKALVGQEMRPRW